MSFEYQGRSFLYRHSTFPDRPCPPPNLQPGQHRPECLWAWAAGPALAVVSWRHPAPPAVAAHAPQPGPLPVAVHRPLVGRGRAGEVSAQACRRRGRHGLGFSGPRHTRRVTSVRGRPIQPTIPVIWLTYLVLGIRSQSPGPRPGASPTGRGPFQGPPGSQVWLSGEVRRSICMRHRVCCSTQGRVTMRLLAARADC
jgi:hypothetical protein